MWLMWMEMDSWKLLLLHLMGKLCYLSRSICRVHIYITCIDLLCFKFGFGLKIVNETSSIEMSSTDSDFKNVYF